ncbi:hypothetical protein K2173_024232 [Erythroxylum novogranatense]|uniref:Uncharacterized protein n=1 Tax=Erythroxylum novogranatense TaxID=1862640 RepID=A0AAV8UHI3_9ROSI|nr:hypothetical protein K2173_024232 [Erythroxylum novogranatense]
MGRGRGKGKKQTLIASHENNGHDEEENFPTYKIRGKSIKPMKEEIGEEELEKIEEHIDNGIDSISGKDVKTLESAGNGRKRKMSDHVKENTISIENTISMKEEDGNGTRLTTDGAMKMVGFRQNGSRRKNKPRRAAEVGIEC